MIRVYSQRHWPGVGKGPLDDCWVLACYMAIHAVAPWTNLPGVKKFRAIAGKPDSPKTSDGANENAMAKGIRGIAPALKVEVANQLPWSQFLQKAKAGGRPAALILLSDALPGELQYGFVGPGSIHAVAVEYLDERSWAIANPLARPHKAADVIEQRALRTAVEGHDPAGVHAVLMPTEATAFKTHSLYVPPPLTPAGFTQAQLDAAAEAARSAGFAAGYDEAKAKAEAAAVAAIQAI